MKYLITMGLPASGKSTWAEEYKESKVTYTGGWNKQRIYSVFIMDVDKKFKSGNKSLESIICKYLNEISYKQDEVIIDGLFTTNEDIITILNNLDIQNEDIVEVHYWKENREQCLINDQYRRNENSTISIENLPFEKIDIDLIESKAEIKVNVEYHEVCIKPQWKAFSDKYNLYLYDNEYIRSEKWSLGGSWRNCWGNSGSVSSETPVEFIVLDNLLTEICPNVSFLQYKKIYNECVETDESSEGDYYGGNVYYAYYKCDVEKLYDKLVEMNLIEM